MRSVVNFLTSPQSYTLPTVSSYGKIFPPGGMAEWFKATDLKSVVAARSPGVRIPLPPPYHLPGFNNCIWGGAREADWARLLSECWDLKLSRGFESRPPRQEKNASERARFRVSRGPPEGDDIRIPPSPPEEKRVRANGRVFVCCFFYIAFAMSGAVKASACSLSHSPWILHSARAWNVPGLDTFRVTTSCGSV